MLTPGTEARTRAPDERRVVHAHLRPSGPDRAWALRWALEDALRCASFDDFGRLVLVRQLHLTRLPRGIGSSALTAAIERAWRATVRHAVPALSAGDPGTADEAIDAAVVWFESPAQALVAALARTIEGAPMAAWFWPRVWPALGAPAGADERVLALLVEALQTAPDALERIIAAWPPARREALRALVVRQAPQAGQSPAMARLPAWLADMGTAVARHETVDAPRVSEVRHGPVVHMAADAPVSSPDAASRPVWREAPPSTPAAPSDPDVARTPLPGVDAAAHAAPPSPSPQTGSSIAPVSEQARERVPAIAPDGPAQDGSGRPGRPAPREAGVARRPAAHEPVSPVASTVAAIAPPQRVVATSPWPWLQDARWTSHAGLLWVLNLLPALGFGRAEAPALVRALLGGLMDRAGLPADDPQRDVLPLVADAERIAADDPEVRRWQAQVRRALRRRVGLSLVEFAQRPGWVTVTPTHADLVLPMSAADLRVRRRGLDRDPGWVPWLGRIVAFHFVTRDDWPEPEDRHG